MPGILHRLTTGAPQARARELIATTEGIAQWRAGRPHGGDQDRRAHPAEQGPSPRYRVASTVSATAKEALR